MLLLLVSVMSSRLSGAQSRAPDDNNHLSCAAWRSRGVAGERLRPSPLARSASRHGHNHQSADFFFFVLSRSQPRHLPSLFFSQATRIGPSRESRNEKPKSIALSPHGGRIGQVCPDINWR